MTWDPAQNFQNAGFLVYADDDLNGSTPNTFPKTLSVSGEENAGDQFVIESNAGGVGDKATMH